MAPNDRPSQDYPHSASTPDSSSLNSSHPSSSCQRPKWGELGPEGERFLENVTVDGPIPVILQEVTAALRRNMSRAAIVRGLGREDRYDYPTEVIRELVTNALMHRDYSPESRGTQVQIELYPDRLVVKNEGGLSGGVTVD